jgi:ubiquinone/menaquinone biosynthesis C-methylase UbiE
MSNHSSSPQVRSYLLEDRELLARETERLRTQAQSLFDWEILELQAHGLGTEQTILDLGCGNGVYLKLLSESYPEKPALGFDRNADLLAIARTELPNATFIQGQLLDANQLRFAIQGLSGPCAVLLRFVLQHLRVEEREQLLVQLAKTLPAGSSLYIIEADDRKVRFSPPSTELEALVQSAMARQARYGGDRTLGARCGEFLLKAGFQEVRTSHFEITTSSLGTTMFRDIFLPIWQSDRANLPNAQSLMDGAEAWFGRLVHGAHGEASYPVFVSSGKTHGG